MAQFTNQAQLSYNGLSVQSNVAVGEIVESLTMTKTAVPTSYGDGDRITYIISVVNSGSTDITGLTLTDNLGAYTFNTRTLVPLDYTADTVRYYSNGILQTSPTVAATNPLTITGLTVPAGGNILLVYETTTNSFAPPAVESSITNTATLSGGVVSALTATETVSATNDPRLSVAKSINPVPVSENGTLTYTFLIQNIGNTAADAADVAALTDTFDPKLSDLTVTFNGTAWTQGTQYNYDQATGVFSTVPGQITVPAATYTQDPTTGAWIATPGTSTLVVSGRI